MFGKTKFFCRCQRLISLMPSCNLTVSRCANFNKIQLLRITGIKNFVILALKQVNGLIECKSNLITVNSDVYFVHFLLLPVLEYMVKCLRCLVSNPNVAGLSHAVGTSSCCCVRVVSLDKAVYLHVQMS